jgi:hypothetical protein
MKIMFAMSGLVALAAVFMNAMGSDADYEAVAKRIDWRKSLAASKADIVRMFDKVDAEVDGKLGPILSDYQNALKDTSTREIEKKEIRSAYGLTAALLGDVKQVTKTERAMALNPGLLIFKKGKFEQIGLPEGQWTTGKDDRGAEIKFRNWRWQIQNLKSFSERAGDPYVVILNHAPVEPLVEIAKEIHEDLNRGVRPRYFYPGTTVVQAPGTWIANAASMQALGKQVDAAKYRYAQMAVNNAINRRLLADVEQLESVFEEIGSFDLREISGKSFMYYGADIQPVVFRTAHAVKMSAKAMQKIAQDHGTRGLFYDADQLARDKMILRNYFKDELLQVSQRRITNCENRYASLVAHFNRMGEVSAQDIQSVQGLVQEGLQECLRVPSGEALSRSYLQNIGFKKALKSKAFAVRKQMLIKKRFRNVLEDVKGFAVGRKFKRLAILMNSSLPDLKAAAFDSRNVRYDRDFTVDYTSTLLRIAMESDAKIEKLKSNAGQSAAGLLIDRIYKRVDAIRALSSCSIQNEGKGQTVWGATQKYSCPNHLRFHLREDSLKLQADMAELSRELGITMVLTLNSPFGTAYVGEVGGKSFSERAEMVTQKILTWQLLD